MLKLLNRIARLLSFILGFLLTFSFVGLSWGGSLGDDEIGFSLFMGFFVGLMCKKIFLSKGFITSRLEFFAGSISERFGSISEKQDIFVENTLEKQETFTGTQDIFDEKQIEHQESFTDTQNNLEVEYEKEVEQKHEEIQEQKLDPYYAAVQKNNDIRELEEEVQENIEPSKFALAVNKFFSENLLAKLGGILVFLGVLFLLSLVYAGVGAVGKIIIGFMIGFGIFICGVILDKKDFQNEGRILLGIGILINYLVILSGRYLIGNNLGSDSFLSDTATFLFLIFNTVFAVVTSLVYKSRTLLLFSFIFAFLNPFLVGGSLESPYLILGYSLIVSAGGLFLGAKEKDPVMVIGVFVLSNLLFLSAPCYTDIHWIAKLSASTLIAVASVFTIYNINKKYLLGLLIGAYIFIILLLGTGESYIGEFTSYISYMIGIVVIFGLGIYCFLSTGINALLYLLLFPIGILLGLNIGGFLISIPLSLVIIVFVYLLGFTFLESKMSNIVKYVFFSILGIYIFFTNSLMSFESVNLDFISFISVLFVSFVFLFTTYFLSQKKGLEYLFSIGTIGGVLMLAPVLVENDSMGLTHMYFSVFAVVIFALSKWIVPFIFEDFFNREHNIKNIVVGVLVGLIFVGYELFIFGSIHFPGVTLGLAFGGLAALYFFIAYMIIGKLGIEKVKTNADSKNAVAVYIGASISLFTLSIALVFSKYPGVISAIWLFETTILFFVYNKIKEIKIFTAGIILFLIGLSKLGLLVDVVNTRDFIFLVPFTLIAASFALNLKYLNFVKSGGARLAHDILHMLGILILGLLLFIIIPDTGFGWSILGISIFVSIVGVIYSYFDSKILKTFFLVILVLFSLLHCGESEYVFRNVERQNLDILKFLQYAATAIIGGGVYLWNKLNKGKYLNMNINLVAALYLIVITSIFVNDIFNTTFAVTIYWAIVASTLFFRGISQEKANMRTLGLYLILLTCGKIFLYDIWFGIDDAISRVVALIFVGTLFIFISTRFTKKFGNNIAGEFNIGNLTGGEKREKKEEKSKDNF